MQFEMLQFNKKKRSEGLNDGQNVQIKRDVAAVVLFQYIYSNTVVVVVKSASSD